MGEANWYHTVWCECHQCQSWLFVEDVSSYIHDGLVQAMHLA